MQDLTVVSWDDSCGALTLHTRAEFYSVLRIDSFLIPGWASLWLTPSFCNSYSIYNLFQSLVVGCITRFVSIHFFNRLGRQKSLGFLTFCCLGVVMSLTFSHMCLSLSMDQFLSSPCGDCTRSCCQWLKLLFFQCKQLNSDYNFFGRCSIFEVAVKSNSSFMVLIMYWTEKTKRPPLNFLHYECFEMFDWSRTLIFTTHLMKSVFNWLQILK